MTGYQESHELFSSTFQVVLLIVQKLVQSDFGQSLESGYVPTLLHLIWAAGLELMV